MLDVKIFGSVYVFASMFSDNSNYIWLRTTAFTSAKNGDPFFYRYVLIF